MDAMIKSWHDGVGFGLAECAVSAEKFADI